MNPLGANPLFSVPYRIPSVFALMYDAFVVVCAPKQYAFAHLWFDP
jgi:hypothetical protein